MKINKIIKNRLLQFLIFLPVLVISGILVLLTMNGTILANSSKHSLLKLTQNIAFYGIFIFIIPIALYILRLFLKYMNPKGIDKLETGLSKIKINISKNIKEKYLSGEFLETLRNIFSIFAKIAQKLHIPVSLIAVSVIGYHVYLAFHTGWVWNLGYITGLIAAILLLIITITGISRIFNKNIKSHKFISFAFVIFTIIHVITIKYF